MEDEKDLQEQVQTAEETFGKRLTAMEASQKDLNASVKAMEDARLKANAAKPGEKYGSGALRDATLGGMLSTVGLVRTGKLKLEGLKATADGDVVVTGKKGEQFANIINDMSGSRVFDVVDGTKTVTAADVAPVRDNAVDAEQWALAREEGNVYPFLRSPASEVAQGTKVALEPADLVLVPTPEGDDYPMDDTNPTSTTRNLVQYSRRKVVSPAGVFDADIDYVASVSSALINGSNRTIDNIVMNADGRSTGNVNSDGYDATSSTDALLSLVVGNANQAGIRARFVSGTAAGDLDFEEIATTWGSVVGTRKIFVIDRMAYAKLISLEDIRKYINFSDNASILTGNVGSLMGSPVIVSDVLPQTDTDGKVTRNSSGVATSVNTKGTLAVLNVDQFEIYYGERFRIVIDDLVTSGGIQIAGRMRAGFSGRNDGAAYVPGTTVSTGAAVLHGINT